MAPSPTAEEIVASKVSRFARNRREVRPHGQQLPDCLACRLQLAELSVDRRERNVGPPEPGHVGSGRPQVGALKMLVVSGNLLLVSGF